MITSIEAGFVSRLFSSSHYKESLSGVAIGYPAPCGKKYSFAPVAPSTNQKLQFEVKNRCKSAEEAKIETVVTLFF